VRLSAAAAACGARYSRYADDLAFSGDAAFARGWARFAALVGAIAADEGFRIQQRKTRAMPRGGRQEITGLVVNTHPAVRRADYDRLRAVLNNCARFGPESQNRDARPDFRDHLEGRIAWVSQVQPTRGAKLRELARRIDWSS
jgi:RNA-directed DNA polymerase